MKLGILIFVTCAACSSAPDAPVAPSDAGSDSELAQDAVADVAAEDIGSDQTDPQDIAIDQTISRGYPIRDVHQDSFSFSANENQKTIGQFTNYVPFYTLRVPNSVGIEDGVLTSVSKWTYSPTC